MTQFTTTLNSSVTVPYGEHTVTINLQGITMEIVNHLIFHGLKQKLGDFYNTQAKGEPNEAELVTEYVANKLLSVPTRTGPRDPLATEAGILLRAFLKKHNIPHEAKAPYRELEKLVDEATIDMIRAKARAIIDIREDTINL